MFLLLPQHFLVISTRVLGSRNHRAGGEIEHSLVLQSEVVFHDAINDGVDGAAESQASGKDENL